MDFKQSRHSDEWDGYTERRNVSAPGNPADPVTREYLDKALKENRHSTREFVGNKFSELEEMIKDGFPGGDTRGHREAHEILIKDAAERAAMWKNIRDKLLSGAVIAALIAVGKIVWEHFITVVSTSPK